MIEVSGLTKRIADGHLKQIFCLYGPSLASAKKDRDDHSRAYIIFTNKKDALYAMDHLAPQNRFKKHDETVIDGKRVSLYLRSVSPPQKNNASFCH